MDKQLAQVARDAIEQARAEGLEDEDAKWLAQGAVMREGREQGVIGEEVDPAMHAAIAEVVKQEMQNNG